MPSPSRVVAPVVLLVALGLLAAAVVWHPQQTPPSAYTGYIAPKTPVEAAVPVPDARTLRLLEQDKRRIETGLLAAEGKVRPFLNGSGSAALAVIPAGRHTLRTLRSAAPGAVTIKGARSTLRVPILVAPGARLTIKDTRLRLRSTGRVQANIIAVNGELELRRTRIRSMASDGGPDTNLSDGRAYLQVQAGRMVLHRVRATYLGHATGRASGVAWMHRFAVPATGGAWRSTFAHNLFGVYSSGASRLRFHRDRFVRNLVYGFDPHGAPPGTGGAEQLGTNDSLVTKSTAAYNGRHGFILSSGCHRNVIRDSVARFNGGSGFVIDDGKPRSGLLNPSNDNVLYRVSAVSNGNVGIVIEGGRRNQVRQSLARNNQFGVRVTDAARQTLVEDVTVEDSAWTGVAVIDRAEATITDSRVMGATVGVQSAGRATIRNLSVSDAVITGLRLQAGDTVRDVRLEGSGARAVDGIQQVNTAQWASTEPGGTDTVLLLSNARHQVWLLLLLTPLALWALFRAVYFVRNLTTRTGL